jgi:uncharacterized protein (TIGR03066 family)
MKTLARSLMALAAVMILAGMSSAADKNKDMIVGKWEPADTKDKKGSAVVEFTKGGDLKISVKAGEMNIDIKGTYKFIDDDTVEITVEAPFGGKDEKKSEKLKIKSIKGDEMVIINPQGKEEKMKRVK